MITTYDTDQEKHVKTTAKRKAQELLFSAMESAFYTIYESNDYGIEHMTEREKELIDEHMQKQQLRVAKLFGLID